jgi:dTDP-4-dehydrorhamnose 3,5-epimerase
MKVIRTELDGVLVLEPVVHRDDRGFFLESYHAHRYAEAGLPESFVQDNHSRSQGGTLRGLHTQRLHPQGKLVRVIEGEVYDVTVDIRRASPTYGRHFGVILSAENFRQVYVPPGFLHGFCVLGDVAALEYKVTDYWHPGDEVGVRWNDPALAIPWPIEAPILSPKDAALPLFEEIRDLLG